MATVQTGEYSKYSNNLIDELGKSKVYLWDIGPEEPEPPAEPVPPALLPTDPKYHLEQLRHRRAVKRFEDELLIYERNEAEYQHWHRNIKGPVELIMWSCDARDALVNDAAAVQDQRQKKLRYYVSSRTRGFEKAKNLGLPAGVVPGPGHQENLLRQFAGEKEFIEALKKDPQFGDK